MKLVYLKFNATRMQRKNDFSIKASYQREQLVQSNISNIMYCLSSHVIKTCVANYHLFYSPSPYPVVLH